MFKLLILLNNALSAFFLIYKKIKIVHVTI